MKRKTRALPRIGLRSLFALLGLLILFVGGAGLVFFRVYDNQLIRQTEAELIAQGTSLASAFKLAVLDRLPKEGNPALQEYGNPIAETFRPLYQPGQQLRPQPPKLALGSEVVRGRAEPANASTAADAVALAAGKALGPILEETKQTTLAGLRIVDAHGTVVASSGGELGLGLGHREEVGRALRGELTSLLRRRVSDEPAPPYSSLSRETGVRVFVALPVVAAERVLGAVILSRTPMTLGKAFYQDRMSLLAMAAILVAAVLAVSLLAAALIVRPVRALIRQTEAVAEGRLETVEPLAHPGTREIALLSESFAQMSTRLAERARYIKGFAASVSHEFKTPLTAMRGSVELLRDHADMPAADRDRFLGNLVEDTERLGQLVHRLLELARADMLASSSETCRLGAVISAIVERYRASGMSITADALEGDVDVRASREIIEAVLGHLIDNARTHGGTDVVVRIAMATTPTTVALDIQDNGPGISEANRARIFEPFFTTNRARGGTGMGLTIARALVHSQGGSIELEPSRDGTCFRLILLR